MARDPLKIVGKPKPTPAEREQAEALAKATGRPAKFCRTALLEAGGDEAKARALMDDAEFVRLHTDFDFSAMRALGDNPMALVEYMMRQQAVHAGRSEADLAADPNFRQAMADAAILEAERPKREAHERRVREAKGRKLDDPVFGPLAWDSVWEGRADVPGFGEIPVLIDTDREMDDVATPPGDEHRKAFTAFLGAAGQLHAEVERANFEYFQRVRPNYDAPGWYVPDVKDAAALWDELSDPSVYVPMQDGKSWRVELTWGCTWDEEHGHAVYVEGGRVVNVGIQGEGYEP